MRESHKILNRDKVDYYSGRMSQEDLDERGWEPLDVRILKSDVPKYVDGDAIVVKHLMQIADQNEKVQLLVSIIDNIKWRSQHIKNAIEWRKFLGGAN